MKRSKRKTVPGRVAGPNGHRQRGPQPLTREEFLKAIRLLHHGDSTIRRDIARIDGDIAQLNRETALVRKETALIRRETARIQRIEEDNARMQKKLDESMDRVDGAVNAINIASGGLQNRAGRRLEETLASVFRYALGHPDIKPESIRLRQRIAVDGREVEADLLMHNNKTYLFEVTFYVDEDKVIRFEERAVAVARHLGLPEGQVEKVLISLDKSFEALESSRRHGILLVP